MTSSQMASGTSKRVLAELVEELADRLASDDPLDVEAWLAGHAEQADDLRRLLPAARMMAELGRGSEANACSSPSAGQPLTSIGGESIEGTLGDFRIERELGRGGMGVVYEAQQISLARRVALKILPFAAVVDPRQVARFKNEAQAAGQLDHPNIVDVIAIGCERGVHYYAMRFIDGVTLAEVLEELRGESAERGARSAEQERSQESGARSQEDERKLQIGAVEAGTPSAPHSALGVPRSTNPLAALSTDRATNRKSFFRSIAELAVPVAEALDHAHEVGVIHRDVKPSNLMLDGRGKIWITDFGLARISSAPEMTITGDLLGTLRYMSPEQALAKRVIIDHRTDIYSLGATLYEFLTLQPVFRGDEKQELLRQIAFDDPRPLRRLDRAIPPELETIVLKALEKMPADRYATAKDLADDLRRFLEEKPIHARRPSMRQRVVKWGRRHTAAVTAAVCVLFLAVVALGVSAWQIDAALSVAREATINESLQTQAATHEREMALAAYGVAREMVDDISKRFLRGLEEQPHLLPTQRDFLEKVLSSYERLATEETGTAPERSRVASAWYRVAGVKYVLGRSVEALEAVRRCLGIYPQLVSEFPADRSYRDSLAMAYDLRGSMLLEKDHQQALDSLLLAQALFRALVAEDRTDGHFRENLSKNLNNLAGLYAQTERYEDAVEAYEESLAVAEQLALDFPEERDYHSAVASALGKVCESRVRLREFDRAEESVVRAVSMARDLARDFPGDPECREDLAGYLLNLGQLLRATNRDDEAREVLEESVRIGDELATQFPSLYHGRITLAHALAALAGAHKKSQQWEPAAATYAKNAMVYGKLADEFVEQPALRREQARNFSKQGEMFQGMGRHAEAAAAYGEATTCLQRLVEAFPENHEWQSRLGGDLSNQAASVEAIGEPDAAHALIIRAIHHQRLALAAEPDSPQYRDFLSKHTHVLIKTLLQKSQHVAAAEAIDQWVALVPDHWPTLNDAAVLMGRCVEAAHQDDGLPEPQRGIVERAYDDRGHELMRQAARHSPPDARQRDAYARFFVFPAARVAIDVELALQMAKSAVELEPNQAAYQQTLGVALCRAGDWQAAIAALEKSIELAPSDSAIDHFFLALAHSHLGDHDTARAWYDKGVEWGDKNPDKIDDDLRGFRAEAAEQVLRLTDKARAEPGDATPYGEAGTAVKTPDSTGK